MKNFIYLLLLFAVITSCSKVYYSSDAASEISHHKTIAILPPTVSIPASKKVDSFALKENQKAISLSLQSEMHSFLLNKKAKGKLQPEILDLQTTNTKLEKVGYPDTPLTPDEICRILNVDAFITANCIFSKPMSDGMALASLLLSGASSTTNEVKSSLNIYSGAKLIFNFEHSDSGALGSNPNKLAERLMKKAGSKFPYFKK